MTSKHSLRLTLSLVAVSAVSLLASGCSKSAAQSVKAAPPVTVAPIERREIVEWTELTGRTEPVQAVEIRPRVSGYIQEVKFQSGQLVKRGDVLFVIDARWHKAEFNGLQAVADRSKVQSENAQREADRTTLLLANKAISTEEADARIARFNEAKAALLAAEAARDFARLNLEYTEVRAPIDGKVSRALLTEGNYVSGVAGNTTVLTTLVSVNPVYVYADVDEETLLRFNALAATKQLETDGEGHVPVELQLADASEFSHRGYIESFDNRLDANTGSILLRAVFPNDDGRIVPGLFARIRIPSSARHHALLIGERAVGTDQSQQYVLTLTPTNTVAYQPVKLGPVIDGKRVVRSGLRGDEKIVVNGLQRVRSGMAVNPQTDVAEAHTDTKIAQR
jgi:multidrug efflux system membrane fusion protein